MPNGVVFILGAVCSSIGMGFVFKSVPLVFCLIGLALMVVAMLSYLNGGEHA